MVDARNYQIDALFAQQVIERHLHAVHRRAGKGVHLQPLFLPHAAQVQRVVHRDGLAHAALRRFGRHHDHAAEAARDLHGRRKSFRIVAVVVGDKYQSLFLHISSLSQRQHKPFSNAYPHKILPDSTCRPGVCLPAKIVKGGRQNENLFPILSVAHFVSSEPHLVVRVVPLYPCRPVASVAPLPLCMPPLVYQNRLPSCRSRPCCVHAVPVVAMPSPALPKPSPVPPEPSPVFRKDNDKSRPETIFLRPVCAE